MQLKSEAFHNGDIIPKRYTADAENISPPLSIENAPHDTKSFVLIVDDPDAPRGTFDHWIIWNIPSTSTNLHEGFNLQSQGTNSYGYQVWNGPSPPPGKPHRYFFKLYALDATLNLSKGAKKQAVEEAMEGHIIAKSELIGIYQR
ncbi:MAG: YbhB/YbcL family Raf kinase inhibitor-like protein [Parachlamydiales bacterium]|jgi:hypothetical protein